MRPKGHKISHLSVFSLTCVYVLLEFIRHLWPLCVCVCKIITLISFSKISYDSLDLEAFTMELVFLVELCCVKVFFWVKSLVVYVCVFICVCLITLLFFKWNSVQFSGCSRVEVLFDSAL